MAFYSDHHAYVSNNTNSTESVQDLISFCLYMIYYMLTRFEVTFLGTLVDSDHVEEEKQGAHTDKREAGVGMREAKGQELQLKSAERHYKFHDSDYADNEKSQG